MRKNLRKLLVELDGCSAVDFLIERASSEARSIAESEAKLVENSHGDFRESKSEDAIANNLLLRAALSCDEANLLSQSLGAGIDFAETALKSLEARKEHDSLCKIFPPQREKDIKNLKKDIEALNDLFEKLSPLL